MAIRKIRIFGEDVLRKQSKPVSEFNERLWTLLEDMAETMYDANGVGLAAPQVGILRRVVVIDVGDGLIELINPKVLIVAGKQNGSEGCLSFPGKYGMVERPMKVVVQAQDRFGNTFTIKGKELLARALSHEIDHLNGTLFTDLATEMLEEDTAEG
ncbi:peptide deformylase [Candidatus Soleaferrea massiliensis]|uniref:peptide deformylase n=1 Tax=Candidatus Soleaferrea massiliensis TaxID=1470354 RepID=UPI00058F9403|nr:peptide deformylase [Candidatus Soleaferrea massiliensis]